MAKRPGKKGVGRGKGGGTVAAQNRAKRRQYLAAELADAKMEFDPALTLTEVQRKWLEGYLRWGSPVEASRYAGTAVNAYCYWSSGGNEDFANARALVDRIHDDLIESRMTYWALRQPGSARFMLRAHKPETYSRRSLEASTGAGERHIRTIEINVSGNVNIMRMGGAGPLDHLFGAPGQPAEPPAPAVDSPAAMLGTATNLLDEAIERAITTGQNGQNGHAPKEKP